MISAGRCETSGRTWLTTNTRTLNLMSAIPLPNERPVYMSIIVVVYSIGAVLGPIVGGLLGDSSATWRWVSFSSHFGNLGILGVALPAYYCSITAMSPTC